MNVRSGAQNPGRRFLIGSERGAFWIADTIVIAGIGSSAVRDPKGAMTVTGRVTTTAEEDRKAVAQMRARCDDISVPVEIDFYLDISAKAETGRSANELRRLG